MRDCLEREAERVASLSLGVRTYRRKAVLCERPGTWMAESSIPAKAAVVAAPILKLWPAKSDWLRLHLAKISRTSHRLGGCFT